MIELHKPLKEQMIENMKQYSQAQIDRQLEKAYQILLTIAQILQTYGYQFEEETYNRFYHLLRGDIDDEIRANPDLKFEFEEDSSDYPFPINFLSIEPKGDSMFQSPMGEVAVEYTYTRSGMMNSDDHAIFSQYLISELDKVVPKIVKEIYDVIIKGGSM